MSLGYCDDSNSDSISHFIRKELTEVVLDVRRRTQFTAETYSNEKDLRIWG